MGQLIILFHLCCSLSQPYFLFFPPFAFHYHNLISFFHPLYIKVRILIRGLLLKLYNGGTKNTLSMWLNLETSWHLFISLRVHCLLLLPKSGLHGSSRYVLYRFIIRSYNSYLSQWITVIFDSYAEHQSLEVTTISNGYLLIHSGPHPFQVRTYTPTPPVIYTHTNPFFFLSIMMFILHKGVSSYILCIKESPPLTPPLYTLCMGDFHYIKSESNIATRSGFPLLL